MHPTISLNNSVQSKLHSKTEHSTTRKSAASVGGVSNSKVTILEDNRQSSVAQRALVSGSVPQGGVVQRLISNSAFKKASQTGWGASLGKETRPETIQHIDSLLRRYGMIGKSKGGKRAQHSNDLKSKTLHSIQTYVFETMRDEGYNPNSGHHGGMTRLVDSIQKEHQKLSDYQVQNRLNLWIPGRATMTTTAKQQLDATWNSITNNRGRINISEQGMNTDTGNRTQVRGFKSQTHAHLARLMATNTGRRLLTSLDSGGHNVNIEPTYTNQSREQQLGGIKAYGAEAPGADREQPLLGGGLGPGVGSASLVRMVPNAKDSEMVDFNAANQPIISPSYIALGHELIHAKHNQSGVAWSPDTHNHGHYQPGQPLAHYHNPEEQHTIAYNHPGPGPVPVTHVTENMMRRDSGLAEREGHTGAMSADVTYSRAFGWLNRNQRFNPRTL